MGVSEIMENRKTFASRLTKEMLVANGYELITEDGKVFKNGKQIIPFQDKKDGYLKIYIYDFDEDGNKIKIPMTRLRKWCKKPGNTYNFKTRTIGLHRAMWAWIYGSVEEGYVVDHKSNKHTSIEDYHISNLQLITQRENSIKNPRTSFREVKCRLDKPISYYEDKLIYYEDLYKKAMKNGDKKEIRRQANNTCNQKAKIRYWLAHKAEA